MARWQITNLHKKSAVERQFWNQDGREFTKEEGFRWGTWECESDERPDIDLDNPDGYELMVTDYDWEMIEMNDGCWVEWTFDISFDDEEQEQIQALWDEEYFEGLENAGWYNEETEQWIFGPITLKNLDTGEEWHGSE
jgi:hypothetical protein